MKELSVVFPEDETLSDRSNTVRMINRMPDDKIWLGTRRGGLYIYAPHLKTIESSRYLILTFMLLRKGLMVVFGWVAVETD